MAVILNPNQPNDPNQAPAGPSGQPLQTVGTAAPSGQAPSGTPMAASQANSLAQNQQKGSGRFTNLQKYLQANQSGGQRIANQVGQGLQKQYQQGQEDSQKYYNQLGQNISQANQTAQQGAGFNQQLQGIGTQIGGQSLQTAPDGSTDAEKTTIEAANQQKFQAWQQNQNNALNDITKFADSDKFKQFQDIQAGRAIDENLLGLQQQRALTASQQAAQGSQMAQQALGSEGGRFDLLRKTFGGDGRSGYTQGQQRLDQMLFGQGGGLNTLQATASQQVTQDVARQKQAMDSRGDVNRLISQEQGLIGDINTQAGKNEQAYMNMLNSYIDPLNKQRQSEFEDLNRAVQTYRPNAQGNQKPYEVGFNADQMTRLGLTNQNQGVYNVFNNDVMTANDIAAQGRQAQNEQDVANQSDVQRYQALSKIMGQNAPQNITQASQIGNAWDSKTGDSALSNRLAAAQSLYDKSAQERISNRFGGPNNSIYLTPEQAIQQGRAGIRTNTWDAGDETLDSFENRLNQNMNSGNTGTLSRIKQQDVPSLYGQLSDYLNQQNYGRTIGGKRETFLDTMEAQRLADQGLTPKIDATPITEYDPSSKKGTK